MTKEVTVRHPAACSVSPAIPDSCSCGSAYQRVQHTKYPFTYPVCPDCKALPSHFKVRKVLSGHPQDFCFDSKGRKIKTLDDVHRVSLEISYDYEAGTFKKEKYKRRSRVLQISDNVSDLLKDHIFPRVRELHLTLEDKIWIEEYMEPFLGDVGIFVLGQVHFTEFIRTFKLKGEERDRAERLFNVIKQEIKL